MSAEPVGGERRILWIDDETRPNDALLSFLAADGVHVELAASGADGLAKAMSRRYDAVLVDLKLPDMFGLTVVRRLTETLAVPVFVATGYYMESEIEAEAMRLGAVAFLRKPFFGLDDLRPVLSREPRSAGISASGMRPSIPRPHPPGSEGGEVPDFRLEGCATKCAQIALVLHALLSQSMPLLGFIGCAAALRTLVSSRLSRPLPASKLRDAIDDAARHPLPSSPKLLAALSEVELTGFKRQERELARRFSLSREYFSRLIISQTGRRYHDWIRLAVMRVVLRSVLENREHVSQIAYRAGYETLSHFDHDFDRTFGTSPRELRRICARCGVLEVSGGR